MNHFIDPASLDSDSPPSPSSSNPRKRPRTDASSDERKEARAHRNRIAAQNSRDRRKAQFSYLERRVAELEEENRALRAAQGIPVLPASASTAYHREEEQKQLEATVRDRENEELRERIKSLERGWDVVLKALAAQGLPLALSDSSSLPTPPTKTTTTTVIPPPIFPISPALSHSSLDFIPSSASTSTSSLPLDSAQPSPSPSDQFPESTRHLARVATIAGGLLVKSSSPSSPATSNAINTASTEPDDAAMENLLMEILASPLPDPVHALECSAATASKGSVAQTAAQCTAAKAEISATKMSVGAGVLGEAAGTEGESGAGLGLSVDMLDLGIEASLYAAGTGLESSMMAMTKPDGTLGSWDNELEMQRILASLEVASEYQPQEQGQLGQPQGLSELDLDMEWGFSNGLGVGVF